MQARGAQSSSSTSPDATEIDHRHLGVVEVDLRDQIEGEKGEDSANEWLPDHITGKGKSTKKRKSRKK